MIDKLTIENLQRMVYIYVRQSTSGQVTHNRESQRLQYRLVERAQELGWHESSIQLIDSDLGTSASGCVDRLGFEELLSAVCAGKVGAIISIEASRLARNGREWHTLLEMCGITNTLLIDHDTVYDLRIMNDRFLLGLKGEMSSMELSLLKERSQAALKEKAKRGELYLSLVAAYVKTPMNQLKKNPDRRVQEVTQLVFSKFREYGTMRLYVKTGTKKDPWQKERQAREKRY
jgi:DNA invertase Pin-like site-specific DNA recombinase